MFDLAERNPPIDEVVQSGIVPRLVVFLDRDDYPQLQVCHVHEAYIETCASLYQFVNIVLALVLV